MNIHATGRSLTMLTRELWRSWNETTDSWQDARSREFEGKYLEEVRAVVDQTLPVFEQLDRLVQKVRSDCE